MNISVGGPNSNQPLNTTQTTNTTQIQGRDITGSGNIGQAGAVPGTTTDPSYSAVLESLSRMMPQITGQMLDMLLLEITTKMKEIEESSQKDKIKVDQEQKRTALQEKADKLAEAEKKINDAIDAQKNASIWDKIKIAFQAIGAALAIVLGSILIATGVGAAAGALLIAAGVVGIISTIDSIVKQTNDEGLGIMGSFLKACGADDEACKIGDIVFGAYLAVAGIALSVATFFVPGAQVNAVQSMMNIAKAAQQIGSIVNGVVGVAQGAGDITAGVMRYQASVGQAEGQKLQAEAKTMEAFIQQIDDFIDQALQRLIGSGDRFNAMIESLMEAIQDQGNKVAKAKFSA